MGRPAPAYASFNLGGLNSPQAFLNQPVYDPVAYLPAQQPLPQPPRRPFPRTTTFRPLRPVGLTFTRPNFFTTTIPPPTSAPYQDTYNKVASAVTWSHLLTDETLDYSMQVNGTTYYLGFDETSNQSHGACRTAAGAEGSCRRIQFCLQPQFSLIPVFIENA